MNEQDPLQQDMSGLRVQKHWALLTQDEADAVLADLQAESLREELIDSLVRPALEPSNSWTSDEEKSLEFDREALLLGMAPWSDADPDPVDEADEVSDRHTADDEDDPPTAETPGPGK